MDDHPNQMRELQEALQEALERHNTITAARLIVLISELAAQKGQTCHTQRKIDEQEG